MKKLCKLLFTFAIIFNSSFSFAADVDEQTICGVQMGTNGRIIVQTCTPWVSKSTCSNGWVQWYDAPDQAGPKGMHAIALAAMMSGKKVMLRVAGTGCSGQFDALIALRVYQ